MNEGSQVDSAIRLDVLHKKCDEINAEIVRVQASEVSLLDDIALKDRFQQFMQSARELLSNFCEVEYNFYQLDRRVREWIAL